MDNNIGDNEELSQDDFAEMLEKSLTKSDDFITGDMVKGKIVYLTESSAFVDISGKSEAIISMEELKDKKGNMLYDKGDLIEAFVVSTKGGEINLTLEIGKGETNKELLNIAYANLLPVEGIPREIVKGGYSVSISDIRCFCPFSQIDIKPPSDEKVYLNQPLSFKIIEYKEGGRNIILSRRALMEEENLISLNKLKDTLKEGDKIVGKISSIQDFGIFIDIGGIEALIPKSELSWSRYPKMDTFKVGENIETKVLSIDWKKERIALSVKVLTPEPWENIKKYNEGLTLNGKVVNIIDQGAFVEIEPGLEGFVHISKMSRTKRINHPKDALSIGDFVNVKIINIQNDSKRVSLELITGEPDPWQLPIGELTSNVHSGTIESSRNTGLSVRLSNGMLGFAPRDELKSGKGDDIQKTYNVGSEIIVSIKDIDSEKRKLILSETGAQAKEEQKDYEKFQKSQDANSSTLGNQFKNKFEELQKKLETKDD
ncbi:S1 RNA-binding domain-containing protein [Spirochaetota bacterium]